MINPAAAWRSMLDQSKFAGENILLITDQNGELLRLDCILGTITDTTFDVSEGLGVAGIDQYSDHSLFGKYQAYLEKTNTRYYYIFRDGLHLQTITVPDLVNDLFLGIAISPRGRHIVIYWFDGSEALNDQYKYLVYRGSR